jgi:predicted dehydrogenase
LVEESIHKQIGLAGCGEWGRHILRDLRLLGCDVHVVARSAASRGRAEEGGAASVVASVEELPEIGGAVVASSTISHAAVAEALLGRGIPVFVEKPLTADVGEAERLAAIEGGRLFVMDKWRYHAGVEALAEIARSGELGSVIGLRSTRISWGHRFDDVDTVWIHAPHDLAIALEILGTVPAARSAVGERADGSLRGILAFLGDDPWFAVEISATASERRREIKLACEGGVAWLADAYADHVAVAPAGVDEPDRRPISSELPLLRELRAFVEHLDGGPPPRSSAAEGVEIVRRIAELRALAGAR